MCEYEVINCDCENDNDDVIKESNYYVKNDDSSLQTYIIYTAYTVIFF